MDLALIEKLKGDLRRHFQEAKEHLDAGRKKKAMLSVETASETFKWIMKEGHRPSEQELARLQGSAQSLGCTEEESSRLFVGPYSAISAKKKKAAATPTPAPTPTPPPRSTAGPHPTPKALPGFKGATRATPKTPVQGGGGLRPRWKDYKKKFILEWDRQHGELEKWDWSGKKHQGSYDTKGNLLKGPDPTKNPITPTIAKPMSKSKVQYTLSWFAADADELVGEESLPDMTAEQVAEWFYLPESDSLMDSYIVRASQRQHLSKVSKHKIDLNRFDYFLECFQVED
jgi:hypothetical protein